MSLLSLPSEILLEIIPPTIPESFEDFALSCRSIYRLSQQFLPRHNQLRKQYRHFTFDRANWENDIPCYSPFQLLARIADEPVISRYIISADFREVGTVAEDSLGYPKPEVSLLRLLQSNPYLGRASIDATDIYEKFERNYEKSLLEEDAVSYSAPNLVATFLLFTLLPNAINLALSKASTKSLKWDMSSHQVALINDIIYQANNNPLASLSKLVTILPSTGLGYHNNSRISSFVPFISIKTVQNFYAGSCFARTPFGWGFYPPSPRLAFDFPNLYTPYNSVENVELAGSSLGAHELGIFLSGLPKLRSFKYSYEDKKEGRGIHTDAAALMEAIEQHTHETLEVLSLSMLWFYGARETNIRSMKRLKKLKEVEIDINMLKASRMEDLHARWCLSEKCLRYEIPRIGDILPVSIEQLIILVPERTPEMKSVFDNIAIDRDEKLPNLKEIVFRDAELEAHQTTISFQRVDPYRSSSSNRSFNGDDTLPASSDNSTTSLNSTTQQHLSNYLDLMGWKQSLQALGPSVKLSLESVRLRNEFSRDRRGETLEAPLMARFMEDFEQRFRGQQSLEHFGICLKAN